jgi:hypothetical protein
MVGQTVQFVFEKASSLLNNHSELNFYSDEIKNFFTAINFHSHPNPNNFDTLMWSKDFGSPNEFFEFDLNEVLVAVKKLELFLDINLTILKVQYFYDLGGMLICLLEMMREPFGRGFSLEVDERGRITRNFSEEIIINKKISRAQEHYSTGMALLAAEDQISGLLDGAFMQFYLAVETILESHKKREATSNGKSFFGDRFDDNLEKIVDHVYKARHLYYGHSNNVAEKGEHAFQIAKHTLVARWCARKLIGLETGVDLVIREMSLYNGVEGFRFLGIHEHLGEDSLPDLKLE